VQRRERSRGRGLERIENKRRPCAQPAHSLLLKRLVPLNLERIGAFKFSSRFAEVKKNVWLISVLKIAKEL
jgi:hypothetical protein